MLTEIIVSLIAQFAPENNLYLEDSLGVGNISHAEFVEVVVAGRESYAKMAEARQEELIINGKWDDSTVNANACRGCEKGKVIVNMYGGLARRPEMTLDGFAIVLCHELSHLYGGAPYINDYYKMSAEGQADWQATKSCYEKIFSKVPLLRVPYSSYEAFIEERCAEDNLVCKNGLTGSKSLGTLLAKISHQDSPQFETPDLEPVKRTEVSYPKTVQCRLDTYAAGIFAFPRPSCWYREMSIQQ